MIALFVFGVFMFARQSPIRQANATVQIGIIDGMTGFAVHPDTLLLNGNSVLAKQQNKNTQFSLPASKKPQFLTVAPKGYRPTVIELNNQTKIPDEVVVEPEHKPFEYTPEFYKPLLKSGQATFIGFVSDSQNGTPLAGARIFCLLCQTWAETNSRGFFALNIPVASTLNHTATLQFEKNAFIGIRRLNVALTEGEAIMYQIRLKPGSGIDEIDENYK